MFKEFKYEKYSDYKKFPLYKYLERFAQIGNFVNKLTDGIHNGESSKEEETPGKVKKNAGGENPEGKGDGNSGDDQQPMFVDPKSKEYLTRDYENMGEDEKSRLCWDEVFAIYLSDIAKKVNPEYYKIMLRFVIAYRECLNLHGFQKRAENELVFGQSAARYGDKKDDDGQGGNGEEIESTVITPYSENVLEKAKELKSKAKGYDFSEINNAEHAPEICNEFVTVFLQERSKDVTLQKNQSIDLTRNICHWLFTESYTCSKVSMIKS